MKFNYLLIISIAFCFLMISHIEASRRNLIGGITSRQNGPILTTNIRLGSNRSPRSATRSTSFRGQNPSSSRRRGGNGRRRSSRQSTSRTTPIRTRRSTTNPFYQFPYSPFKRYEQRYYRVISEPTSFRSRYPWSWSSYFQNPKYGNYFYKSSGIPKISRNIEPGQLLQVDLGGADEARKKIGELELEFYGYRSGEKYYRSGVTARTKRLNTETHASSFDEGMESFKDDLSQAFDDDIAAYNDNLLPPSTVWNSKYDKNSDLFADACAGFLQVSKENNDGDMERVFDDSMNLNSPFRNKNSYFVQLTSSSNKKTVPRKFKMKSITSVIESKTKKLNKAIKESQKGRKLQEKSGAATKAPQASHLVVRYLIALFERFKAKGMMTPEQATRFHLCLLMSIFKLSSKQCTEDRIFY